MNQLLTFVILSTGLENFKEIRSALATDSRARLLAGGDDLEQVYPEIINLRPSVVVIAMSAGNAEQSLKVIERLSIESPQTAIICAARDASPDLILRSMRAGAREFLRLPIIGDEFKT